LTKGKKTRKYIQVYNDGSLHEKELILSEYIRNLIHHPENRENEPYRLDELKQSIEEMRKCIFENIRESRLN
jgi:hypothetical protein